MKSHNKRKVTVIILNWNGWQDTVECLESLYQINYHNYNVLVVDNHSEDDSIEKINDYCKGKLKVESKFFEYDQENKPVKMFEFSKNELNLKLIDEFKSEISNKKLILLKNHENYGFAEGNNIGIRFVLKYLNSDYILLLNNDTVVDKHFLDKMVEISDENDKIGVVGPKSYYYDYNGKKDVINFEGGKVNFFKGEASHILYKDNDTTQHVDYIEGSCLLIKKEAIEKAGVLDKDYFLYWEETDWCTRIKRKGFDLVYVPQAKIWHKVGLSLNKRSVYYMARNQFLFMKKNSTKFQMLSFLVYFFLFKLWYKLLGFVFYYKEPQLINQFVTGTKDGFKLLLTK